MPCCSPEKRAAASAALPKTKLEVRNSASLCSPKAVRCVPARTAWVSKSKSSTDPSVFLGARRKIQIKLAGVGFITAAFLLATRIFHAVEIRCGDVARDIASIEARGFKPFDGWIERQNRSFKVFQVLIRQTVRADFTTDLFFVPMRSEEFIA